MQTHAFLQCVLPPAPAYFMQLLTFDEQQKAVNVKGGSLQRFSIQHLSQSIDAAVAKGYDVYMSMAGYPVSAKGHYAQFAQSHRTFYADVDCGPGKPYPDQATALRALVTFINLTKIPAPLIVSSGNGIHLYWPCIESLDTERWVKIAWLFRAVAEHAGFALDGRVTIDPVRLLRPVGSLNRKVRNEPKDVRLLYEKQESYQPHPLMDFLKPLVEYAKHEKVSTSPPVKSAAPAYDSDLFANMPGLDPYSADAIADAGCVAVKWFVFNGGDAIAPKGEERPVRMSNGDWMAMARLAKFSTEGEAWFHANSAKYKGYSAREAQGVLDRTDKRGVTCATLVTDPASRRAACARCQHCGKINSPLHLGTAKPPPLEDVAAEDLQQSAEATAPPPESNIALDCPPSMEHRGYSYDMRGVWRKNAEGKKGFVANYMIEWIDKVEQDGKAHYAIHWRSPGGRRISFELAGSDVGAHPPVIMAAVGAADISFGSRSELIVSYIRDWIHSIQAQDATPAVTQMGWQEDGSFVIGNDCYKEGRHYPARLVGPVAEDAAMFTPRGTLEGQLQAIRTIFPNHPDFVPAHILLLGSLVPFVLKHDRMNSPTISAYSLDSGHGKSLTESGLTGFWGNPAMLEMKGEGASMTAVNNRLAATGSIPLVLDELTGIEPQRIFQLVNLIQGNKTNDRANTDGTNRIARTWRTVAYISTNEPLRQKLQAVENVTDGVSMRLIEFEYRNPTVKEGNGIARINKELLFEHYGHVSRYVAQQYTANLPHFSEMYFNTLDNFLGMPGESSDNGGERIWHRWFADVQMLAHLSINVWKLFDMDYSAICKMLVLYLKQQRSDFHRSSPDELTRLNDVIWKLSRNAIRLEVSKPQRRGDNLVTKSGTVPTGDIVCRQEDDTGLTYIYTRAFNDEAKSHGKKLIEFAIAKGLCEPQVRRGVRLKAYLGLADTQVNCYVFYQKVIDRLVNEQKGISAVVDTYEDESAQPVPHASHLHTVK